MLNGDVILSGCAYSTIADRREQSPDRDSHAGVPGLTPEVFDTRRMAAYAVA
jgi:hypothetical protein